MKLTVFNGSPRGKGGNTEVLLRRFLQGYSEVKNNTWEIAYLRRIQDIKEFREMFMTAEYVMVAFPLYTDSMPAIVKKFIEVLEPLCQRKENPPIGFIVQSGFPEPCQSRPVEKYLEKLARRLGCKYLGTIIKGGAEGVRLQPDRVNKKLFQIFTQLGREFGIKGELNEKLIATLAPRERKTTFQIYLFNFLKRLGLTNFYWNYLLKQNKAYDQKDHQPYA